ncbi:MAG: TetR family transcriptional regulator [Draconibacterium sp.]|nr:TetR family transcriptional regulator [Draconibacterium sp.]
MSEIKKDNTEEKILNAAQAVFIQKGMDGSRMQEIADHAGINKALVHYYFRTKQKLYEAIFRKVFKQIFPKIETFILSDQPIEEKLTIFIENYIDVLLKNPYLPTFILKEINRDPEFLASVLKSQGIHPNQIFEMFEREMEDGKIRKMDPRELLVNLLSLSIFPFAAKPLMQLMLFENDKKAYKQFLQNRKTTVQEFVLNSILLKDK